MLRAVTALSLLLGACASAPARVDSRSYSRPGLEELPLRRLELVVVAEGPVEVTDQSRLDLDFFPAPRPGDPVTRARLDGETVAALRAALGARLVALGFAEPEADATSVARPAAATSSAGVAVERLAPASTSTATVERTVALPRPIPATLEAAARASAADGILLVRVLVLDRFVVDVGQGTREVLTEFGRERVHDSRPELREGRLLLGQAFLFDRGTLARLWSRQLPDFPEGGRLMLGSPILEYGFVAEKGAPVGERPRRASAAFAERMLAGFPRAQAGSEAARAALDGADLASEEEAQSFFDQARLRLALDGRWSTEPASLDVSIGFGDESAAPALESGALTPNGVLRIVPSVAYQSPTGLLLALAFPIGVAPNDFARSYHVDNPAPNLMTPEDRSVRLVVGSSSTYGVEAAAGRSIPFGAGWLLEPTGGLFFHVLAVDAEPARAAPDTTRMRLGVKGGVDVVRRFVGSPLFLRLGPSLRFGVELGGPLLFALEANAGLGVFL